MGAASLAISLALAPRVCGDGDSSEFTAVLATLGLAHPTGYALFTILGSGFVNLVHALGGAWAFAANAWSSVCGAVALGLWHALATRLLGREGIAGLRASALAILPAIAFGLNPIWTHETTLAEINAAHVAWVAGACLFALASIEAIERGAGVALPRRIAGWALLAGLGLSHHATSAIVALPLSVALVVAARRTPRASFAWGGLVVLPVLVAWSYVYFRSLHPAAVQWGSLGPGIIETWNHVIAAGYRHYLGGFTPSPEQRTEMARWVAPFLVPGVALAAWPFAKSRGSRALRAGLAAAMLLQVIYAFSYGVDDPVPYFLPAVSLGLFAAPAALASLPGVRRHARALIAVLGIGVVLASWFGVRASRETRTELVQLDSLL